MTESPGLTTVQVTTSSNFKGLCFKYIFLYLVWLIVENVEGIQCILEILRKLRRDKIGLRVVSLSCSALSRIINKHGSA